MASKMQIPVLMMLEQKVPKEQLEPVLDSPLLFLGLILREKSSRKMEKDPRIIIGL